MLIAPLRKEPHMLRPSLLAASLLCAAGCSSIAPSADIHVRSTPETVVWGHIPEGRTPVVRVQQGQTVSIDTVSHQGIINGMDPVKFFAAGGVERSEVLQDALDVFAKVKKGEGAHVLTGPVYVEGAEPGDMLEVRMLDFRYRVPYGVNNSGKGGGVVPELHSGPYPKIIRLDTQRRVALFAPGIEVPLPVHGHLAAAASRAAPQYPSAGRLW